MGVVQKGIVFENAEDSSKKLKVIYDCNKTYKKLLDLSETVCFHQQHLRFCYCSVQKYFYFNPTFMCCFFTHKEILYNLRKGQVLSLPPARLIYYGTNSVHFWGFSVEYEPNGLMTRTVTFIKPKGRKKYICCFLQYQILKVQKHINHDKYWYHVKQFTLVSANSYCNFHILFLYYVLYFPL